MRVRRFFLVLIAISILLLAAAPVNADIMTFTTTDALVNDIYNYSSPALAYSDIRNGIGYQEETFSGTGLWYSTASTFTYLQRVCLVFDTSGLPDDAVINKVNLSVTRYDGQNALGIPYYYVTNYTPDHYGDIVVTDFNKFDDTKLSDGVLQSDFVGKTNVNFTFTATGLARINKTGYTHFMIRDEWDVENNFDGTYSDGGETSVFIEQPTGTNPPFLTVIYNEAAAPTAAFSCTPTSWNVTKDIVCTDASSNTPTSWSWNVENGSYTITSAAQNPTFHINWADSYNVNMSATNAAGSDWENKTAYLTLWNNNATVIFNRTPAYFTNDTTTVVIVDTSTGTNLSDTNSWNWSIFNTGTQVDVNVTSNRNWSHIFPVDATNEYIDYYLNHSVVDSYGTSWSNTTWLNSTSALRVYANSSPMVSFTADTYSGAVPLVVTFDGAQVGDIHVDAWCWTYGDGNFGSTENPSHTYTSSGTYDVWLDGFNYTLGNFTLAKENYITVTDAPVAAFSCTPTSGAINFDVTCTDASTGTPTAYYWSVENVSGTVVPMTSAVKNPIFNFSYPGAYNVNMSATNAGGTDWENKSLYVGAYDNFMTGWNILTTHYISGRASDNVNNSVYGLQIYMNFYNVSGVSSGDSYYSKNWSFLNFSDLRITNSVNTTLPFWKNYTFSDHIDGWFKMDELIKGQNNAIYIYENNSVSTAYGEYSNGYDTFMLYDHFIGTSLNTSQWTLYNGGGIQRLHVTGDSNATIWNVGGGFADTLYSNQEFNGNVSFTLLHYTLANYTLFGYDHVDNSPLSDPYNLIYSAGHVPAHYIYSDVNTSTFQYALGAPAYSTSVPYIYELQQNYTGCTGADPAICSGTNRFKIDGSYYATANFTGPYVGEPWVVTSGGGGGVEFIDYIYFRKYVEPEATHGGFFVGPLAPSGETPSCSDSVGVNDPTYCPLKIWWKPNLTDHNDYNSIADDWSWAENNGTMRGTVSVVNDVFKGYVYDFEGGYITANPDNNTLSNNANFTESFTFVAWINSTLPQAADTRVHFASKRLRNNVFDSAGNFTAYDLAAVDADWKGFRGSAFDGRFLYLIPYNDTAYSGEIARYDTRQDFSTAASWTSYDLAAIRPEWKGFRGAVFDGRFLYLVPYKNETTSTGYSGTVVRYDTCQTFASSSSWVGFNAQSLDSNVGGYASATFDGRYIYFAPYERSPSATPSGYFLRYDTLGSFTSASSWSLANLRLMLGNNYRGFRSAIFDGKYVYMFPYTYSYAVRYDTDLPFTATTAYQTFDVSTITGGTSSGFRGSVFDRRYIYAVPSGSGDRLGTILRYDTTSGFQSSASYSTYNLASLNANYKGYVGAAFDGRYVYYGPGENTNSTSHGYAIRYDTTDNLFTTPASYSIMDLTTVDSDAKGFRGVIDDGANIYYIPSEDMSSPHGTIVKYSAYQGRNTSWTFEETTAINQFGAAQSGFSLNYWNDSIKHTINLGINESTTVFANTWVHVALTFDKRNSTAKLYVNGENVKSAPVFYGIDQNRSSFQLFNRNANLTATSIRLYDNVLAPNQILQIYQYGELVPDFNGTPRYGLEPLSVYFVGHAGGADYGSINWSWDFNGDGSFDDYGQNRTYIYTTAGTYEVRLRVNTTTETEWINKSAYISVANLIPSFYGQSTSGPTDPGDPPIGITPLNVIFNGSSLGTSNPDSWSWDVNEDGIMENTTQNMSYIYNTAGVYDINLTITNGSATNTTSRASYVTVYELIVGYTANSTGGEIPLTVEFTDTTVSGCTPTSWKWDFDFDNVTDCTTEDCDHTYTNWGWFTVNHTACCTYGCNSTIVYNAIFGGELPTTTTPIPFNVGNVTATTGYGFVDWRIWFMFLSISLGCVLLSHGLKSGNDIWAFIGFIAAVVATWTSIGMVQYNEEAAWYYTTQSGEAVASVTALSSTWLLIVMIIYAIFTLVNILYVYIEVIWPATKRQIKKHPFQQNLARQEQWQHDYDKKYGGGENYKGMDDDYIDPGNLNYKPPR